MIANYDSIGDFCRVAQMCRSEYMDNSMGRGWYGNLTTAQTIEKSLHGDDSLVGEAEALLEQLDASVEIPANTWVASRHGAYPIVPEFLAGSPEPMRALRQCESDSSPLAIYVSTTCSSSVDAKTMRKRGVALLALVIKMQAIRPIELYLLAETHGRTDGEYLQVIKVDSKPVELSVACFVLTNVAFARHLTYSVARDKDGFNGMWPMTYNNGGASWEAHVREVLGMSDNDLYIGAARAWDPMVTDSVKWVNEQVARFTKDSTEDY